ncbi:universal stress protein [Prauserella marina]|uniref:Nucleotide-binding universal stress protein, UspA family n=1 Tax=Prauserella marina TaxID=530584 RepID=A0A222VZK8_9PSEU|nr:universal stress protein [Prauserella marina]ASR39386.1 universal stress protein [Prauserella marina]PWV73884.1 nucleotide-binding universal stress UspA family protein [Prauserella marina]SDD58170.1 Nucleotide-binding universal stress protein, UspA family [Prauserella marina]
MSKIVVGVDGSPSAVNAAVWAARDAAARSEVLRLVHTYFVPMRGYPGFLATYPEVREGMRHQGQIWLDEARTAAEQAAPGVEVETDLLEGEVVPALLEESAGARLVVIGSRGLGGFTGMLVGSVAVALAAHGDCPVTVVRGAKPSDQPPVKGPVVVGVDGSEASLNALEFAFEEASARGVRLIAVHTWNDVTLEATLRMYPFSVDPADVDAEEKAVLDAQVALWQDKFPGVEVETVVERGRPVRALLERAGRAQLVVVGSRGRGGFTGMLLGSTSRALVTHAPCPVAIVRPPAGTGRAETDGAA